MLKSNNCQSILIHLWGYIIFLYFKSIIIGHEVLWLARGWTNFTSLLEGMLDLKTHYKNRKMAVKVNYHEVQEAYPWFPARQPLEELPGGL